MMDINSLLGLENIKPEDINRIKLQLQSIDDAIRGGLRSANLKEYRNTYVINAQDSLDATYPMYVHFNIIPEMVKIVSIQISFWFQNFRAYATAASSGGAVSSASGGGETPTSSSGGGETPTSSSGGGETPTSSSGGEVTSASGGGQTPTSSSGGAQTSGDDSGGTHKGFGTNQSPIYHEGGYLIANWAEASLPEHTHSVAAHTHTVTISAHTHTGGAHTHQVTTSNHTHTVTTSNHTHTVTITAHTHTGGAHTHGITYGIYEDSQSPTIMFSISKDNGLSYSLPVGSYTADHENLDITSMIDTAGGKLIKFTSNARTRLSVQIAIKLDIKVR